MNSENESEDDSMKPKAKFKIVVDLLMTLALLFLMGYHLWGEILHEWVGAGMLVLFIAHHILNEKWHKTLFKGKYNAMRTVTLVIGFLVLASMLAQMYSGIVMSRYVFSFLPIHGGMAVARRLHILASYWGFLLMSLHLGLHWNMILSMVKKKLPKSSKVGKYLLLLAGALIAVYGVFAFIKRDFPTYLFLRSEFVFLDYAEPIWSFYLDYFCLMGLWVFLAHFLSKGIRKFRKKAAAGKK